MVEKALNNYILYDFVRVTAAPGLLLLRPRCVYASKEAKGHIRGGAIVIANHSGFADPVYLMAAIWYRRHHFICMKAFFDKPFNRWLFTQFHCIPIDRENFSMDSFGRIVDELKSGHLVSMFPEGHVNTEAKLAPFKSGMVLMALRSAKPVIPVYIMPRRHWYSRLTVGIGQPLDVAAELGGKPTMAGIERLSRLLEERERELSTLINQRYGGRQ